MIDPKYRCFVYFNLHTKLWSVRQRGKVIAHVRSICLRECRFLVGEAGRLRVLAEKRKNVHAGVSGYHVDDFVDSPDQPYKSWAGVSYNPYKYHSFVRVMDEMPVFDADLVDMDLDCPEKVVAFWKAKAHDN